MYVDLGSVYPPFPNGEASSRASHAHPSPGTSKPHDQDVRELLANIEFLLTGLPGATRCRVTDVYCPEVRRSPTTNNQHVTHLDVVTCWKGLSFCQAREIWWWERVFKHTLERQLLENVLRVFAAHVRDSSGLETTIPYFIDFISAKATRLIDIDIPKLVYDMAEKYYEDESHTEYEWFISSQNLPATIYNFLRTRDCFLDTFPYPSLEISFGYKELASDYLLVFGSLNWYPPAISFPNLPVQLHSGAEYRILPSYKELDLGSDIGPNFLKFPTDAEFTVASNKIPVAWDSNLRCFRAIVPEGKARDTSENQQQELLLERINGSNKTAKTTAETKFSANIITAFPNDVRFEQTTRYSIKLDIKPKVRPKDIKSPEAVDLHPSPHTPGAWLPSYSNTPLSKCRRDSGHEHFFGDSDADTSPNTSSVERGLEALGYSRKVSLWSCANFTDEVGSQVDCLNQNRRPSAYEADEKSAAVIKDVEYDADHDGKEQVSTGRTRRGDSLDRSLDAILHNDPRPKYQLDRYGPPFWQKSSETEQVPTKPAPTALRDLCGGNESGRKEQITSLRERIDRFDSIRECFFRDKPDKSAEILDLPDVTLDHRWKLWCPTHQTLSQKRKATNQMPISAIFETPSTFLSGRLALDKFEHLDLELATKRQRLDEKRSERIDSGIHILPQDPANINGDEGRDEEDWGKELLPGLADITTGRLGEALCTPSSPNETHGWFERLSDGVEDEAGGVSITCAVRSRAYEARLAGSKVMPALKKRGSVKRMVFRKHSKAHSTTAYPSPEDTGSCSSDSPVDANISEIEKSLQNGSASTSVCSRRHSSDVAEAERRLKEPEPKDSARPSDSTTSYVWPCVERHQDQKEIKEHSEVGQPEHCFDQKEIKKHSEDGQPEHCFDQEEIIKSYRQFLKVKETNDKANDGGQDDEREAFEQIFLYSSTTESGLEWDTDDEDLSGSLEGVSMGEKDEDRHDTASPLKSNGNEDGDSTE